MSQTPPPPPPGGYGQQPYGQDPKGQQPYGYGAPGMPQPGQPVPGQLMDRFLARLIDGLVMAVAYVILSLILGAILVSSDTVDLRTGRVETGSRVLFSIVFGIVIAVVVIGYQALMESRTGQSLGKMAMKLKVVGPDGVTPPTLQQAIRRNIFLAWPIGNIIPVVGAFLFALAALVGEILIAVGINNDTVRRQAWHDHFAGETQVLKIG